MFKTSIGDPRPKRAKLPAFKQDVADEKQPRTEERFVEFRCLFADFLRLNVLETGRECL